MDQDNIVSLVNRAGVLYEGEPKRQVQFHQVRFVHSATHRSLNLGYQLREGCYVADFVFMRRSGQDGNANLDAFLRLFGGSVGDKATPFARLKPAFAQEAWLVDVIRAYWAMGNPMPRRQADRPA
jgi:hypothetical protein